MSPCDKWSFGVVVEQIAVTKLDGTSPATPQAFINHPGKSLVQNSRRMSQYDFFNTKVLHALERSIRQIPEAECDYCALVPRRWHEWRVKHPESESVWLWTLGAFGSLDEVPSFWLENYPGYYPSHIRILSPAMLALPFSTCLPAGGFSSVQSVLEKTIHERHWFFDPSDRDISRYASLKIHVGRAEELITLRDLRRCAAMCYVVDAVLVKLHPSSRHRHPRCVSNRLYSHVSRGVTAEIIESVRGWRDESQSVEDPSYLQEQGPEDKPDPTSYASRFLPVAPPFERKIERGLLAGYVKDTSLGSTPPEPLPADLVTAFPQLQNSGDGLATTTALLCDAVRELLSCTDHRTVAELMACAAPPLPHHDPIHRARWSKSGRAGDDAAYSFFGYSDDSNPPYSSRSRRRATIVFQQAAYTPAHDAGVAVAWVKIAVRLCEWACQVDLATFWDLVCRVSRAEEEEQEQEKKQQKLGDDADKRQTAHSFDAFDLLVELGLGREAEVIQDNILFGDNYRQYGIPDSVMLVLRGIA